MRRCEAYHGPGVPGVGWGLALGGGAVLGAAHLGVLRALGEWGLQPDVLAGTSAGGLVAGALAAGAPLEGLVAFGAEVSRHPLRYLRPRVLNLVAELLPRDPLPPPDSLFDASALVAGLTELCPRPHRIEAWRRPAALTAVDLAGFSSVAFVGGPPRGYTLPRGGWQVRLGGDLRTALQATMAMPGVFAPVRGPAEVLVDGGLADLLPLDWAAALGARRILAVAVAAADPTPPGTGLPWVLGRSVAYATSTMSALRRPPRVPLLTLAPDTGGISGFAFGEFARLVELGYAAASARRAEVLGFIRG